MSSSYRRRKDHKAFLAQCLGKTDHIQMSNYSGITDWCANHFGASHAAAGGGLVGDILESITLNNDASYEIITPLASGKYSYSIELRCVQPASDGSGLSIQISQDGGSTYKSGATDYTYRRMFYDGGGTLEATDFSTGYSEIRLAGNGTLPTIGNATGEAVSGEIYVGDPTNTGTHLSFLWNLSYIDTTGEIIGVVGYGTYITDKAAINGIKLYMSSNLKNGKVVVKGRKITI